MHFDDESTVLIDTKKYFDIFKKLNGNGQCADNEVYQECGTKCVLGCHSSLAPLGITIDKNECDKLECVKGCFCNDGFVRRREKCVPFTECSSRQDKAIEWPQYTQQLPVDTRFFGIFKPSNFFNRPDKGKYLSI